MGFPRQDCWSGLPFPFPEILPDQGLNPCLLHWQANSFPLRHQEGPMTSIDWADFVHKNPWVAPQIILPTRNLEPWSLWSIENQTLASNTAGREPLSGFLCLCFPWNPSAPGPRKLWLDIQKGQQRGRTQGIASPGSVLPRALILLSCDVTGSSNGGSAITGVPLKARREPAYQVLFLKPPCMGAK